MKQVIRSFVLSAAIALPFAASAQQDDAPKGAGGMNCPMMSNSGALQKGMGDVRAEMADMMKDMTDPAMKARMQKMHDHMSAMMAQMQKNGGMMGGGMMGGGMMGGQKSGDGDKAAPPPAAPDDHSAHHPNQ
ncbi:hypothetical protein [Rhodoblastus sp.]|uniref:hypothetical protein n=1 Tax=Rhodoblastus sp. TaxID=1962975 RepID=UPI0035ADFDFC